MVRLRNKLFMAQRTQLDDSNNQMHEAYSCLLSNGLDGAAEALRIMVNEACRIERAQHLQAAPYERSAQRQDQQAHHGFTGFAFRPLGRQSLPRLAIHRSGECRITQHPACKCTGLAFQGTHPMPVVD